MTAVTIQSNKIVSNEVQDILEPLYRKTKQTFWPTHYLAKIRNKLSVHAKT